MKKIIKYFKECAAEMKKVVWPSKATVISNTKIVLISTIIVALVLGLVDFLLLKGMYLIF